MEHKCTNPRCIAIRMIAEYLEEHPEVLSGGEMFLIDEDNEDWESNLMFTLAGAQNFSAWTIERGHASSKAAAKIMTKVTRALNYFSN